MCNHFNNDESTHYNDIEVSRRKIIKQLVLVAIGTLALTPLSQAIAQMKSFKIGGKEFTMINNPQEFVEKFLSGQPTALIFELKDYLQVMKQLNDFAKSKSVDFLEKSNSMNIVSIVPCGLYVPNFVKLRLMGLDSVNVGSAKDWVDYKCPRCGSGTVMMLEL